MYTRQLPNLYPDYQLAVSLISGQHSNMFSQFSHPFERGAVRFLFWWLFLHRRLRFGNEAQLSLSRFAPPRRVLALGCHSFLSEWLEKVSQLSLAEPFGSNSGVNRSNRPPVSSLSRASPHRLPIPLSVSKAATLATGGLYSEPIFRSNFCVFYFWTTNNDL